MALFRFMHDRRSPGEIVGGPEDPILYRILSVGDSPERAPSGGLRWKAQLVRATEDEESVFRVMAS
jgi:hypothetical protein